MIFATVGTQLPFDRLVETLDKLHKNQSISKCFAQIGPQGKIPESISFSATLTPLQFAKHIADCKVIVSHAGMGTILTAMRYGKPIIIMPRLAKYGEHRNDHQLATVANLRGRAGIHVAQDESSLMEKLRHISSLKASRCASSCAEPKLISAISNFINTDERELEYV
ncbi:hypothetical protein KFE96_07655 [Kordiimonas sp. SCSIO 12603]|uniref:glycosyltransferase n=1 Tax=Kordiimonas sp. SCSIO 12603 TaxID=2829596 RepID=UPI0021047E18|nr:glycosyltransferase [Kordiimonas sp. SCSIO 12603]UTW60178.1 hypothetical protein KFE96_07655 [Kordiimonas sp. SCSIO 12603]